MQQINQQEMQEAISFVKKWEASAEQTRDATFTFAIMAAMFLPTHYFFFASLFSSPDLLQGIVVYFLLMTTIHGGLYISYRNYKRRASLYKRAVKVIQQWRDYSGIQEAITAGWQADEPTLQKLEQAKVELYQAATTLSQALERIESGKGLDKGLTNQPYRRQALQELDVPLTPISSDAIPASFKQPTGIINSLLYIVKLLFLSITEEEPAEESKKRLRFEESDELPEQQTEPVSEIPYALIDTDDQVVIEHTADQPKKLYISK